MDIIREIAVTLTLAAVCAAIAALLRARKQQIVATVTRLIQEAEEAVQGSGLGPEKKAKVIAQLQAMGITVTDKLSKMIDDTVAYLNAKSGWLVDKTKSVAASAADAAMGAGGESDNGNS